VSVIGVCTIRFRVERLVQYRTEQYLVDERGAVAGGERGGGKIPAGTVVADRDPVRVASVFGRLLEGARDVFRRRRERVLRCAVVVDRDSQTSHPPCMGGSQRVVERGVRPQFVEERPYLRIERLARVMGS
jgi:hypothetical protein